jgi:hypothetical protein
MRRLIVVAVLIASFSGFSISALGQGKSQGRGRGESNNPEVKKAEVKKAEGNPVVVFGSPQTRIIREWFGNSSNLNGLPPGLAKKDRLPPGLEKQLRRNGTLPPGLEKKIHPMPRDLEVRLPRLPDGHRYILVPGSVIVLDSKRNLILDILSNLF